MMTSMYTVQGDSSGCSLGVVEMETKLVFYFTELQPLLLFLSTKKADRSRSAFITKLGFEQILRPKFAN